MIADAYYHLSPEGLRFVMKDSVICLGLQICIVVRDVVFWF